MQETQSRFVQDFQDLGDEFAQYSYLIDLSSRLPEMSEMDKRNDLLVPGCQSKVWLDASHDDVGMMHVRADSDTVIMRGMLFIICSLFDGRPASEASEFKLTLLEETSLGDLFSQSRRDGLKRIIAQLNACAKNATA